MPAPSMERSSAVQCHRLTQRLCSSPIWLVLNSPVLQASVRGPATLVLPWITNPPKPKLDLFDAFSTYFQTWTKRSHMKRTFS